VPNSSDLKTAADSLFERFSQLDDERQAYMLRTLAAHLRDARQHQRLYALIDKPWMDLKRERTASQRAFAQDVEVALQAAAAGQPPNVMQEVRCSLIFATLGGLATSSPPIALAVLAYAGQLETARGLAALMQDRIRQVEAYLGMAAALRGRGRTAAAQSMLNDLPALADSIENASTRSAYLARVSRALAQQGDLLQALSVARSLEDAWHRATTLAHVAQALAETDQQQGVPQAAADALQAAQAVPLERRLKWTSPGTTTTMGISDPGQGFALARVDALGQAAVALAVTGQVEHARAIVEGLRAGRRDVAELIQWRKAQALAELASALAHRGQPRPAVELADQAQRLAAKLKPGRGRQEEDRDRVALYRGSAMAAAGRAYAEADQAGHAEEAARWALQELQDAGGFSVEVECGTLQLVIAGSAALQQALLVLAQTGDYALAQLAAGWIEDGWVFTEALIDLADVLLAAGQEEPAREVLGQVESGLDEATTYARALRPVRSRLAALDQVALLWRRLGADDRARAVTEEALAQARTVSSRSDRAEALSELAQTLALCGAEQRAVEVASRAIALTERVGDRPARLRALASLAQALAEVGRMDEGQHVARLALTQASRLKGKQDRAAVLSRAALALTAAGAGAEAAKAAQQAADSGRNLRRPANRAEALAEAGLALASAGLATEAIAAADDAQRVTPNIRRVATRSHALGHLAVVWAAAGAASRAQEVAAEALSAARSILRVQKVDVLCLASLALHRAHNSRQARSTAERALAVAQAIREPVARADAHSKASWALLRTDERDQALEAAQRVVAATDDLAAAPLGSLALSRASRTLAEAGRIEQALLAWRQALRWARQAGRTPVYAVLENGASMLASLDEGDTAWRAFQAVMAVEAWWG
jgi:tetratricopeptide (TPR) repeat protein